MDKIIGAIFNAVLDRDASCVQQNIQVGLDAGLPPRQLLSEGMIAAMKDVWERFENGEYFVPEMLVSARAMQMGLAFLKPHLVLNGVQMSGKVAIGTVKGDLQDIGKNLVTMMLEGAGVDVKDLWAWTFPLIDLFRRSKLGELKSLPFPRY